MSTQSLIPTEQTPLLTQSNTDPESLPSLSDDKNLPPLSTKQEIWLLIKFAAPTYVTLLLEASLFATTVVCVGHLGTAELAASTMASMTAGALAFVVIQGMATALDTLCAQSWTSAHPSTTSLHALRTASLLTLFMIPQIILFWNARSILLFIGQDPEVARLAGVYLKITSAGLPASAWFECLRRWLQAQGLMHVPTVLVCFIAPLNVGLNYFLVWSTGPFGLGFIGAPISVAICWNLMFFLGVIYVYFFVDRKGWGGFTKDALTGWGECFKLGMAGIAMVGSESWALQIMEFGASYLGPSSLAANSVLGTTQFLFYLPSLAISIAGSVRLGNLLGADKPKQARKVARIALVMGCLAGGMNMIFIATNKSWIGKIFTSQPDVLILVKKILPVVAFYQLTDSTAGVGYGIMRGAGQSPTAALITGVSYWVIGLPLAFTLMFPAHLGVIGEWYAVTFALLLVSVGLSIYIVRYLDFEKEADKARERSEATAAAVAAASGTGTGAEEVGEDEART